jgi:hypothetical protein
VPARSRKSKPKAPKRIEHSELVTHAAIRAVREIRSGYSSFEMAEAVNDLLRRGWVLLGAQFVTSGSGADAAREFLYVLGSTDGSQADAGRSPEDDHFANLAEYTRRIERGETG